jgi:hypothetical protein
MIVSQLLAIGSLWFWVVVAGLSVMAFDEGGGPEAWAFVLAVWAYPLFPLRMAIINEHPSAQMIKGNPSDLCRFDEKRASKKPEEPGWTEIFMDGWDEGLVKAYPSDFEMGYLPLPP